MVIYDHIRPPHIPGSCFNIIIAGSIDNRLQIRQKDTPTVFFQKLCVTISIDSGEMYHKFFHDQIHIQNAIRHKLIFPHACHVCYGTLFYTF